MRRTAVLACLVATAALLPLQAEAAKFRSGGRGSSAKSTKASGSLILVPGAAGIGSAQAAEAAPQRVPFPPSSTPREEPLKLRLTSTEGFQKPWCGSSIVVGGFCLLN